MPFKKPVQARTSVPLSDLLERSDALARLQVGVRQARALSADLGALLPDYLVSNVETGGIQDGVLSVLTRHSALAARLRHLEPGLIEALAQKGWPIRKLKIRISPQPMPNAPPAAKAKLSPAALASLSILRDTLTASPLRESLERMVEHHTTAPPARKTGPR